MTMIPVANPGAAYRAHREEIDEALGRVARSGWYIMGEEVSAFEHEFAAFVGADHCISAATGTDALVLILRAMGIGPGDAVVTVSHTAVATVSSIDLVGAHPLLVDIDEADFTMSPDHLDEALSTWSGPPVKAIVPVHLYGHPADLDRIMEIAGRYGVPVVEDCAQAHGASYRGRSVGTFGVAGAFSFYPTKNLGALGDGGAVVTSDAALDARCRLVKQYGWQQRYVSEIPGINSRLDEIQAAVLRVKLKYLSADNGRRVNLADAYRTLGANPRIVPPGVKPGSGHVYHQYVVQSDQRDRLETHCRDRGVGTSILYPLPVHRQPAYAGRVSLGPGGLPVTERVPERILCLPVWPEMSDGQRDAVVGALREF